MNVAQLRNKFNESHTRVNLQNYKKQNSESITDNKKFWKTMKPLFFNKVKLLIQSSSTKTTE